MQLVPVNATDKGLVHHINPASIVGITDYGAYRIVIFGQSRIVHTKQTLSEIKKAIEEAERQPGDSYCGYGEQLDSQITITPLPAAPRWFYSAGVVPAEAATDVAEGIVCLDPRTTLDVF